MPLGFSSVLHAFQTPFRCDVSASKDIAAVNPTEELFRLAKEGSHNVKAVLKLVKAGADVMYASPQKLDTLPSYLLFASTGRLDCFHACLSTSQPMDFSARYLRWTFNHMKDGHQRVFVSCALMYVCVRRTEKEAKTLLCSLLNRLARQIDGDKIDWEFAYSVEEAFSFLSHAADQSLLHILWPVLKEVPYFKYKEGPIPIQLPLCESDWAQLSADEQRRFMPLKGFVDPPTAELRKLSVQYPISMENIRASIQRGARVQHQSILYMYPLALFVLNCHPECVAACMETPHPVDFTLDENGKGVFMGIFTFAHNAGMALEMLTAVVNRIAQNRPGDKVDWEERDWFGHDFFAYAAEYDLLHVVWPIVKELPHFQNKQEPIPITRRITLEDWDQLSEEDQQRFEPVGGFIGRAFRIRSDRVLFHRGVREVQSTGDIRWRNLRELGHGNFGVVYLGKLPNESLVAVKIPNYRSISCGLDQVNRILLDEMEIMRHLRHKNIVKFFGAKVVTVSNQTKQLQIFMEYCPGFNDCPGSLEDYLVMRPQKFTMSVIRCFTKQMLEGLVYLHRNQVVHRDLKPANVLLTADGVVKLTDFGCSKNLKSDKVDDHSVAGTPLFIAPEVFEEEHFSLSFSVDVWALGCTVWQMLRRRSGKWRGGDSGGSPTNQRSSASPVAFTGICPHDPEPLQDFLLHCFEREPRGRWTAGELLCHRWITCAESELEEVHPMPVATSDHTLSDISLSSREQDVLSHSEGAKGADGPRL